MSLIGVFREQILVGLQRIVKFHFRRIAVAAECALRAVGFGQGHDEVVDADQPAFDLLTGGQSDGDRCGRHVERRAAAASASAAARHQKSFCSCLGSENLAPMPFRSPVAEWQPAQLVLK